MNGISQSFYMGTFFVISGFLSRVSLERKSRLSFVKDKFVRLGIPALVYTLVGPPMSRVALRVMVEGKSAEILGAVGEHWMNLRGILGPVWYCALLLIFDTVYALVRPALPVSAQEPGFTALVVGIALSILTSFGIRLLYPTTYIWPPLNLRIGYCPQYVLTYILGLSIRDPLAWDPLPSPLAWLLGATTIGAASAAIRALETSSTLSENGYAGGLNAIAGCYAVANETLGYLLFAMLFMVFRRFANVPSRWNRYAYGAFLVHPVVSVAIEAALDGWKASGGEKLAAVGTMNIYASWAVGRLLVGVPGLDRVI